ncbi:MAG: hypothetical protein JXB07_02650 [Anaerolineae bacterium]|nr:hypothetical protein [Anaerolineae bacterium]
MMSGKPDPNLHDATPLDVIPSKAGMTALAKVLGNPEAILMFRRHIYIREMGLQVKE